MDSSMDSDRDPDRALAALYYTYPAVVLVYFVVSTIVTVCKLQTPNISDDSPPKRRTRLALLATFTLILLTYIAQLVVVVAGSAKTNQWPPREDIVVSHLFCILVFGIQFSQLADTEHPIWYPFRGSWFLALLFDIAIGAVTTVRVLPNPFSRFQIADVALVSLRCAAFVALLVIPYLKHLVGAKDVDSDEERQPLLPDDEAVPESTSNGHPQSGDQPGYNTTTGQTDEYRWERRKRLAREAMEKRLKEGGNWFEYTKGFAVFFPYIWPVGNRRLQLRATAVIVCLLASNALNLLIPRQIGIIMDSLSGANSTSPWLAVLIFATLRLVASESGIELVRQWLWIPVKFYSRSAMSRAAYSHMMHLSADFHDSKSSSDMMVAIRGGSAISSAVESILLQAVPMVIDMGVAIVYLSITFGPYEGFVTIATGIIFLILTSRLVSQSKVASRKRLHAMYHESYLRQSGLLGWQTVSAFNQIGYEDNRHANAVATRWLSEQQYMLSWYLSIAVQTIVLSCGLLASAFLAVYRIQSGAVTSGQFAMLLMYWAQLTSPLHFFSQLGKNMSDDFIDAERLLEVMKTKPSVENRKGARPLKYVAGSIEFENVRFSYDGQKMIIKDVNLQVPAGQTVAFVGATGAGKSTLLRLLGRFYDVTGGDIKIDGQDIRDVDLFSLRDRIGIVPQDPILFDDTVMNNVRYGRITAGDDEVHEACRAACIHDNIEGFTDGYETRVGERGVKLSGGELQRIAIARAILKQPDIVLLDEATSAVDTDTEQQIQSSLKSLCNGRTTFIVAHRLSTIMNADRIVVVEHGEIIEEGAHKELILANGRYAELWSKQFFLTPQEKIDVVAERKASDGDTSSEQTATEVSKPKDSSTDSDGSDRGDAPQEGTNAETPQQQTKEGSKLNPIAPAFTPRSTPTVSQDKNTTGLNNPVTGSTLGTFTPGPDRRWSDEISCRDAERHLLSEKESHTKTSLPKVEGENLPKDAMPTSSNKGSNTSETATLANGRTLTQLGIAQFKHPRYSRRVQSKSEPSQAPPRDTRVEEQSLPVAPLNDSPDEDIPVHRRVSAPSLQPSANPSQIPKPGSRGSALSKQTNSVKHAAGKGVPDATSGTGMSRDAESMKGVTKQSDAKAATSAANTSPSTIGNENELPSTGTPSQRTVSAPTRGYRGGRRGKGTSLRGRRRGGVRSQPLASGDQGSTHD